MSSITKPKSPRVAKPKSPRVAKPKSPRVAKPKSPRAAKPKSGFPPMVTFRGKEVYFPKPASAGGKPLPYYALLEYVAVISPFYAFYDKNAEQLAVYKLVDESRSKGERYTLTRVFSVDKLFVGKSAGPLAFEGFTGPEYDGNTILFHLKGGNNYVVFNKDFKEFQAISEIKSYSSPIDMVEESHPYALDNEGNLYDFTAGVVYPDSAEDYKLVLEGTKSKKKLRLEMKTVIKRRVTWKPDSDATYYRSKYAY